MIEDQNGHVELEVMSTDQPKYQSPLVDIGWPEHFIYFEITQVIEE